MIHVTPHTIRDIIRAQFARQCNWLMNVRLLHESNSAIQEVL